MAETNRLQIVLVQTSFPTKQAAESCSKGVVERHLGGCAQVSALTSSFYYWQGKLTHTREYGLVIKTSPKKIRALKKYVLAMHTHSVPEFIVIPASQADSRYANWLYQQLQNP